MHAEGILALAKLSKLKLNEDEIARLSVELDQILKLVDKLSDLDTADVPPATHVFQHNQNLRDDTVSQSMPQSKALQNAPEHDGKGFVIPMVVQGGN